MKDGGLLSRQRGEWGFHSGIGPRHAGTGCGDPRPQKRDLGHPPPRLQANEEPHGHPFVTRPAGRVTLHTHCGKSESYTLVLLGC